MTMDEYTNNDAFYAAAAAASADVSNTLNVWNTNLSNERIARENREYQYNAAVNMWNMQNEYNSPKEAMQRLTDAGINPFVAAAQVANVNHAGELHPPTQQGIPAQPFLPAASGFSQMASALAQLADAKNKSRETELLEKTMSYKVRQDLNLAEKQEFDLYLDRAFAGIERSERLRELRTNIEKLHWDAFNAKEQGDLASMQYQLANAERYLTELKAHEQFKRNQYLEQLLQGEVDQLRAAIKELTTRSGVNVSQSLLNGALKDLNVSIKEYYDIYNGNFGELLSEKIKQAARDNMWPVVTKIAETIGKIFGAGVNWVVPVHGSPH